MSQTKRFAYDDYFNKGLDLASVDEHLQQFVDFFVECQHVVDIGCGSGIFLKHLQQHGLKATGIENNPELVVALRAQGFPVISGDATGIWADIATEFDGAFCSHVIEHMPFENVISLVEGLSRTIQIGGVVVFAFPNPESLEMQLFQFWRDPQHVRFYHSDLIAGLLRHYRFEVEQVYSQGSWGGTATSSKGVRSKKSFRDSLFGFPGVRKVGRGVKAILGINALEIEADYMRKLRAVGREVVIVSRKLA